MTHTKDEALRMALEALEVAEKHLAYVEIFEAVAAIKQALAAPVQEPVAWAWRAFDPDEIIDDLHALFNTEMIRENDSGDALIRLDDAVCMVEEAAQRLASPPAAQPATEESSAVQPAPEQYTALEQALTRLQKRYGELEAKVAAQPSPVQDEWTPCMKLPVVVYVRKQRPGEAHVSTREGITPVKPDDLIMRGVLGEEYPIGRAIFEQTYTLNTTPPAQPEPVQERSLTDLAAVIEYADARWSGVDVPIEWARHFADAIGKLYTTPPAAPVLHTDDLAVDRFATSMKAKMAKQRAKGYGGWDDPEQCPASRLQKMLAEHLAKGDPVDVGNFAMMLWNRGESTTRCSTASRAPGVLLNGSGINEQ